ncbi:MAG: hypothetical protein FWB97_08530 [Oscillospiraceae bacterium]|nr:hypothetical protein [Oscillospiraceae bacterium]
MLKKTVATLLMILLILTPVMLLIGYLPASASTQFRDLIAEAAILADVDSGEILFQHNIGVRHPADALARIMTLLLAVESIAGGYAYEDDPIEMTETAWEGITARNTTLNIRQGEIMPLLDLMYAAFVGAAAEANNMLAEHIAGSVDAFVMMMNARAAELGAENTNFTNAHGLFNERQFTTAYDQFVIFREATSSELFLEVAGVFRHNIEATNASDARRLTSSNSLLNQSGRYFFRHNKAGIASITFEGGHSYVGVSESEGLSLIAVILGSDEIMLEDESFDMRNLTEARRLFEWGYAQFGWRTILSTTSLVSRAPITHGAGADYVLLRPESEIRLLLNNDIPLEDFVRHIRIFSVENDEPLVAPIVAGDILGEITIIRAGVEFGPIQLLAHTNVDLHSFEFMRRQVADVLSSQAAQYVIWGLVILVLAYIALIVRYNINRRKRLARIADAKQKLAEERQQALQAEYEERQAYYDARNVSGTSANTQQGMALRQNPRPPQRQDPRRGGR